MKEIGYYCAFKDCAKPYTHWVRHQCKEVTLSINVCEEHQEWGHALLNYYTVSIEMMMEIKETLREVKTELKKMEEEE